MVAGERLEYLLVSTHDPRLKGDIGLSIVGPDSHEQNTTSVGQLERGSAIFMELGAPQLLCAGPCWLRTDFVPSLNCSAGGALCSCNYSELIAVIPGHPGHLKLGPSPRAPRKFQRLDHHAVACTTDKFGNLVKGNWKMLLQVVGFGWSRSFPRQCFGGYTDMWIAGVQVPECGEYECAATLHLDNITIDSPGMWVLMDLPREPGHVIKSCIQQDPAVGVMYPARVAKTLGGMESHSFFTVSSAKLTALQRNTATAEIRSFSSDGLVLELEDFGVRELDNCLEQNYVCTGSDCTIRLLSDRLAFDCSSEYHTIEKCTAACHCYRRTLSLPANDTRRLGLAVLLAGVDTGKTKRVPSREVLVRRIRRVLTDHHIQFGEHCTQISECGSVKRRLKLTNILRSPRGGVDPRHSDFMLRYAFRAAFHSRPQIIQGYSRFVIALRPADLQGGGGARSPKMSLLKGLLDLEARRHTARHKMTIQVLVDNFNFASCVQDLG